MKLSQYLFLFLLILLTPLAQARVGLKEFRSLPPQKKIKVLKVYRQFFAEFPSELGVNEPNKTVFFEFIQSAYAIDEDFDCFYAGWPSKKVAVSKTRSLCSSPQRGNSTYSNSECGGSSLHCNPLLFGPGLCANTSTQKLRNSAFSQCEKNFKDSGRKNSDVVKLFSDPKLNEETQDLFTTVEKVCSPKDAPAICRSLERRIEEIMAEVENIVADAPQTEEPLDETSSEVKKPEDLLALTHEFSHLSEGGSPEVGDVDCKEDHDHNLHAQTVAPEPQRLLASTEINPVVDEQFPRKDSRYTLCSSQNHLTTAVDRISCIAPDDSRPPGGFNIRSRNGHPYLPDYGTQTGNPSRQISIKSSDHALNETYIYLGDYGGGPDSHDVKSMVFIIPRKSPPKARVDGDDVIVTLSTGEDVVFDGKTGAVKAGVLTEGHPDFNPDRFKRSPPNVQYEGSGISIRLDHRFQHPTAAGGDETAEIKQGGKTCTVARSKIFNSEGKLLSSSDKQLLNTLNSSCPGKNFSY